MNETQQSICVAPESCPDFPNALGAHQFLEIRARKNIKFFNELKNPNDLLCILRREFVEELLNWTFAACLAVEDNGSHETDVNIYVILRQRLDGITPDGSGLWCTAWR